VEEILIENNKAVGLRLRSGLRSSANKIAIESENNGLVIKARKAVVSNCDMWTTYNLVPRNASKEFDEERDRLISSTPMCKSFMHLHLGNTNTPEMQT
jgi:hypothetical protein